MRQAIGQAHILYKILGIGQTNLIRLMIENPQPTGAGNKVNPVSTQVGMRRPVPLVENKFTGGGGDGLVHNLWRKKDSPAGRILRQSMIEQALAQGNASHLNTHFTQDSFRFGQNLLNPLLGKNF